MKVIQIKAEVPGAGKTFTLVKTFKKFKSNKKIILTPSNKARQNAIRILKDLGENNAENFVKTIRMFKKNYIRAKVEKYWDFESSEWIEKKTDSYITIPSKRKESRKPYDIFIDEVSMISEWELNDLINNFWIRNLVTAGDINQFDPIGGWTAVLDSKGKIIKDEDGTELRFIDQGKEWKPENPKKVVLNKSMRARDPKLVKALKLIKEGKIIEGICHCMETSYDCEKSPTDTHIAYTNNKVEKLNKMYENVVGKKWVVSEKDDRLGLYKMMELDDAQLEIIQNRWVMLGDEKESWENYKSTHFKLAFALTCHKLQGSTIEKGNIFIHIDDILLGKTQEYYSIEDFAKLFQKYIYIAVSRAVSIEQVNMYGLGVRLIDLMSIADRNERWNEKAKNYSEKCNEVIDMLIKIDHLAKPMQDEDLSTVDLYTSSDSIEKNPCDWILEHLDSNKLELPSWIKEKHEKEMRKRNIDYSKRKQRMSEEAFLRKIKNVKNKSMYNICKKLKLMSAKTFLKYKHLIKQNGCLYISDLYSNPSDIKTPPVSMKSIKNKKQAGILSIKMPQYLGNRYKDAPSLLKEKEQSSVKKGIIPKKYYNRT